MAETEASAAAPAVAAAAVQARPPTAAAAAVKSRPPTAVTAVAAATKGKGGAAATASSPITQAGQLQRLRSEFSSSSSLEGDECSHSRTAAAATVPSHPRVNSSSSNSSAYTGSQVSQGTASGRVRPGSAPVRSTRLPPSLRGSAGGAGSRSHVLSAVAPLTAGASAAAAAAAAAGGGVLVLPFRVLSAAVASAAAASGGGARIGVSSSRVMSTGGRVWRPASAMVAPVAAMTDSAAAAGMPYTEECMQDRRDSKPVTTSSSSSSNSSPSSSRPVSGLVRVVPGSSGSRGSIVVPEEGGAGRDGSSIASISWPSNQARPQSAGSVQSASSRVVSSSESEQVGSPQGGVRSVTRSSSMQACRVGVEDSSTLSEARPTSGSSSNGGGMGSRPVSGSSSSSNDASRPVSGSSSSSSRPVSVITGRKSCLVTRPASASYVCGLGTVREGQSLQSSSPPAVAAPARTSAEDGISSSNSSSRKRLTIGIPPSPGELPRSCSGSPLSPAAAAVLAAAALPSPKPGAKRVSVWLPAGSGSFKSRSPRPSSPASEGSAATAAAEELTLGSDLGGVSPGPSPGSAASGVQDVGQGLGSGQGRVSLAPTGEAAGEIEGVCAASWLHRMRSERQLGTMRKSFRKNVAAGRMSRVVSQKERDEAWELGEEEEEVGMKVVTEGGGEIQQAGDEDLLSTEIQQGLDCQGEQQQQPQEGQHQQDEEQKQQRSPEGSKEQWHEQQQQSQNSFVRSGLALLPGQAGVHRTINGRSSDEQEQQELDEQLQLVMQQQKQQQLLWQQQQQKVSATSGRGFKTSDLAKRSGQPLPFLGGSQAGADDKGWRLHASSAAGMSMTNKSGSARAELATAQGAEVLAGERVSVEDSVAENVSGEDDGSDSDESEVVHSSDDDVPSSLWMPQFRVRVLDKAGQKVAGGKG